MILEVNDAVKAATAGVTARAPVPRHGAGRWLRLALTSRSHVAARRACASACLGHLQQSFDALSQVVARTVGGSGPSPIDSPRYCHHAPLVNSGTRHAARRRTLASRIRGLLATPTPLRLYLSARCGHGRTPSPWRQPKPHLGPENAKEFSRALPQAGPPWCTGWPSGSMARAPGAIDGALHGRSRP